MKFCNIVIASLFFNCFLETDTWRRRRHRRRSCSPRNCEVSSWSSWISCSAEQCGSQGSQRRTRWRVSEPSCGGSECPTLQETRQCYGTRSVNCQLSSWSAWSACSTLCGVSGIQTSARHRIITERCGGSCSSTLRKTKGCQELSCLNGGSLKRETCYCKEGYSGHCCEKGKPAIIEQQIFRFMFLYILFLYRSWQSLLIYTAVYSTLTHRSSPWGQFRVGRSNERLL